MIEFYRRAPVVPQRLGILARNLQSTHRAHLALARAAEAQVDEVLFVLPREFPHKVYEGASFEERIEMLQLSAADERRFSIASTAGGLFIDIARECRDAYGDVALSFLCGRDAAERIVNCDGAPEAFGAMLGVFDLLVRPAAATISLLRNWRIAFTRCRWNRITMRSQPLMSVTGLRAASHGSTL